MINEYLFKEITMMQFLEFKNNEYSFFYFLHQIQKENKLFPNINIERAKYYYKNENLGMDEPLFYDVQLKSYLIKYSEDEYIGVNQISNIIEEWMMCLKKHIGNQSFKEFEKNIYTKIDLKYYKYIFPYEEIDEYYEKWMSKEVTLNDWKQYPYIEIHKDIFTNTFFTEDTIEINDKHFERFKNLSDEYSKDLFNSIFSKRLKNNILSKKENTILTRIFEGNENESDNEYIKNTFALKNEEDISVIISKCLADDLKPENIDIHSLNSYSIFYAIIKYYEELNNLGSNTQKIEYAIWIKYFPTDSDKKSKAYIALENIFDYMNSTCIKCNWGDFKSIFNKSGCKTRIQWDGDVKILNFIFRKLGNYLAFRGGKWVAISYYFNPENKESLFPNRIQGNSHHQDEKLEKLINLFISSLS